MRSIYTVDTEESVAQYASLITQNGFLLYGNADIKEAFKEIKLETPNLIIINFDTIMKQSEKLLLMISEEDNLKRNPIIILSNNPELLDKKAFLNYGVRDFLSLPINQETLSKITSEYIEKESLSIETIFQEAEKYSSVSQFINILLPLLSKEILVNKIAIMLIDEQSQYLSNCGAINISPLILKKSRFKVKKSLVTTIRKFSKPIRTNKLFSDLRFMDISFEEKEKLLQMETDVIFPLHFMENFQGILILGKKRTQENLTNRELSDITKLSHRICSFIFEIRDNLSSKDKSINLEDEMSTVSISDITQNEFPVHEPSGPLYSDASPKVSLEFSEGDVFANRYVIKEHLGKGTIGVVYRVLDNQLDEEIVIKIIYPELTRVKEEKEKLKKNMSLSRHVSQKNIAPYYDFKEYETFCYLTMGYLEGKTLKDILIENSQLSVGKGIDITKQICNALSAIHESGMVHGNLKPKNIIIDETGMLKLLDLSMGRPFDVDDNLSTDIIYETAEYISPEQAGGEKIDARSDIYSLGVIMYQMFAGVVPFASDTPIATALLHIESTPMSLIKFNTYLPFTLENIILKCLEKKPEMRFQTISDLTESMEQLKIEQSEGVFSEEFIARKKDDQVKKFMEQGEKYFILEQYLDCISEMKKILSLFPQHIKATEMIELASKKLEIDPSGALSPHILELSIEQLLDKAQQLLSNGEKQACIETVRSALKIEPENSIAIKLLSEAQKRLLEEEMKKRKEEEKHKLREIKQLYKEGKNLFKMGEFQECIDLMNSILELDSMHSGANKFILKAKKKLS